MNDSHLLTVAGFTGEDWKSASPHLRLVAPCRDAGLELLLGTEWVGNNLRISPELVALADLVVIQRDFPRWQEGYRKVIDQARELGKPVVYELDDLLTELPADHADSQHYLPARWAMLLAAFEADVVTVTTPELRSHMEHYNAQVRTLPNYLDNAVWELDAEARLAGRPLTIGYAGSRSHVQDLAYLEPVLLRLLQRYGAGLRICFWGKAPVPPRLLEQPGVVWDSAHELDYSRYANRFSHAQFDIAIAPLVDSEFNSAKSHLKYLEYSALGVPGVYSACQSYGALVDGNNGLLAASSVEWEQALIRLIEDERLRHQMGQAALSTVRQHLLSDHAHRWKELYVETVEAACNVRKAKLLGGTQRELSAPERAAAAQTGVLRSLVTEYTKLQSENHRLGARVALLETIEARLNRAEENVRWLESELQQTRNSITWRATEPIRKAYALVQSKQTPAATRPRAAGAKSEVTAISDAAGAAVPDVESYTPQVAYRPEDFYWHASTFAAVTRLPVSQVTDVIICIGKSTGMAEKCIRSIQQHTDPSTYRLKLVVHEADIPSLPEWLANAGEVIPHTLDIFNFAIANNLALRRCEGDAVLLNDDTEVTAGWLKALQKDSAGVALTGARTGRQCSGNPDMWDPGPARVSWYPINMFCTFIPRRVREVIGLLDEEFFYYGGEDVDYSCRALQHGFALVVSSAFVQHVGNQTFKGKKERLMQESNKILLERYMLTPPFALHSIKPTVSVITATRNRAGSLTGAVRSILAGSYPEMQVVIVDDSSSDGTPAAVAELQREDSRVLSVRLPQQSGSVGARLVGLNAAYGNFVAFMDDDDTAWTDRILAPLQYLMRHPQLDVAYCGFDIVGEKGRERGNVKPFNVQEYLDMKFDIGLGVLLLRRRALIDVPFMRYYERAVDYDWVFRLVRRGYELDYCPAVVLDYNRHGSAESHLAGNAAAVKQHTMIQDRENLVNQLRRRWQ
jgi:processive 1,2-diacylglycerol beta-glucosyltransferase